MTRRLLTVAALFAGLCVLPAGADDKKDNEGFVPLFNGKDLKGWKVHPEGTGDWKVEGGAIVGTGKASHLFTERGDFENFHYRAEVMINEGGNSGQYFRTQFGAGFPKGYEAQINSTHRDPVKTGSLYRFRGDLAKEVLDKLTVKEQMHKPGEWVTQEVIANGNHIVIKVNGTTTVDFMDDKSTFTKGHFAFQQHHEGNVVKIRKAEVKELPATKKDEKK